MAERTRNKHREREKDRHRKRNIFADRKTVQQTNTQKDKRT